MAGWNEHNKQHDAHNVEFFFVVLGLPKDYNWQQLKDLARRAANPGWADIEDKDCPVWPDRHSGWIRLRLEDDAHNLFDFLTSGPLPNYCLSVYMWKTTKSPLRLDLWDQRHSVWRNQPIQRQIATTINGNDWLHAFRVHPELYASSRSRRTEPAPSPAATSPLSFHCQPTLSQVGSPSVAFTHPRTRPESTTPPDASQRRPSLLQVGPPSVAVRQSRTRMHPTTHPQLPHYQPTSLQLSPSSTATRQPRVRSQPTYVHSKRNGLPVNVSAGAVETEARGVFVGGLHSSITEKQMGDMLKEFGKVEHCRLRTSASGASRVTATAKYATRKAALEAIKKLNGAEWMGRQITVREDLEHEIVHMPSRGEPETHLGQDLVIANGSARSVANG